MQFTALTRFASADDLNFVQVGDRLLSVHVLQPYPGWRQFFPLVEEGLAAALSALDQPALQRIGLRYINRINLGAEAVNLDSYFNYRPHLGECLPQEIVSFLVGCDIAYQEGRDACRLTLMDTNVTGASASEGDIQLDLDYFLARPKSLPIEDALAWVEAAHDRIGELFEGCITDLLRQRFEELSE